MAKRFKVPAVVPASAVVCAIMQGASKAQVWRLVQACPDLPQHEMHLGIFQPEGQPGGWRVTALSQCVVPVGFKGVYFEAYWHSWQEVAQGVDPVI